MSKRKKQRGTRGNPPPSPPSPRRASWIAGGAAALLLVAAVAAVIGRSATTSTPAAVASGGEVGVERLVGRWVRPDGGYVLEIRNMQVDGRMEAAYLNPRSIKVSRAEWKRDGGAVRLFVELRDSNYPGSTYSLRYLADQDRLVGAYFQAVQGQTFDVEFVRKK